MTYCLAIEVDAGLVFMSDSRTSAGVDNVRSYGKMHTFGTDGDRQLVILSSGNLASTQAVLSQIQRDIRQNSADNLLEVEELEMAAAYLGRLLRQQSEQHEATVKMAGSSAEASFIVGGQIGDQRPTLFLVYPQGNYITTSENTPYLQLGEAKYGRPILDRIIDRTTSLDQAALCALVSMDSTLRSNVSVGPPIEILKYETASLKLGDYLRLEESDPRLIQIRSEWNECMRNAFSSLSAVTWRELPEKPRFR
jgi:putative proteasome-type protease